MGSGRPHLWNGSWLSSFLRRSAYSDLWKDCVWEGKKAFRWGDVLLMQKRNLNAAFPFCSSVFRCDFPPTSARIWKTCWETCCRWTWPNVTATWRTESMTSKATNGSPRRTGSQSTSERWNNPKQHCCRIYLPKSGFAFWRIVWRLMYISTVLHFVLKSCTDKKENVVFLNETAGSAQIELTLIHRVISLMSKWYSSTFIS